MVEHWPVLSQGANLDPDGQNLCARRTEQRQKRPAAGQQPSSCCGPAHPDWPQQAQILGSIGVLHTKPVWELDEQDAISAKEMNLAASIRVISLAVANQFIMLQCIYCVTHEVGVMNEATFTFRVEEELKENFATAAKARDRTGAQLLRDFMRDFVKKQQEAAEHDVWFRRQVQVGLDSANAGNLVSAEDVEAEFSKRREQTRQKFKTKS